MHAKDDRFPVLNVVLTCSAVMTILALSIAAQIYLSMPNHGHSFARILVWQFGSWNIWAVMAPLIFAAGARYAANLGQARRNVPQLAGLGVVLILIHRALASELAVLVQPFRPVETSTFAGVFLGSMPSLVTVDLFAYVFLLIAGSGVAVYRRARQLELRELRLEGEVTRAQLDALRLEIRPHFLFNTLNSIAALIRLRENDRALEMLLKLSELMRTTLDTPARHVVPVSSELTFLKRYVDLQQERFGDRLTVDYCVDPECDDIGIPTLLLQPLAENALRHGVGRRSGAARVEIGGRIEEGRLLRMWVVDDGPGLPAGFSISSHAGTGLRNTRSRLEQIYGSSSHVDVTPLSTGGVRVEVIMPAVRCAAALEASP